MFRLLSCFSPRRRHATTPPPSLSPPPPSMPQSIIFNNDIPDFTTTPPSPPTSMSQPLLLNDTVPNFTTPAPPSPPSMPQPLTFTSINPNSIDQPPQSWLEMGLSGHSVSFSFNVGNNQEIILDMQNRVMFLALIASEGMRLGLQAYQNHMNSPPVENPNMPINIPWDELPFYHPEQPEGPVLAPYIQSQIDLPVTPIQVPTFNPSNSTHETPQIEEDTTLLPSMALQHGIRPKCYLLNSMKSFIIEGEYIKKYILMCPVRLNKCTMDIRVITNSEFTKYATFLVPMLQSTSDDDDNDDEEEPPKMCFMIWNCRGSKQSNFRKGFRSMLNYHRPTMILLLDTHMTHHQHLADEFSFSDIANVPAVGGCGGMALVWKRDYVAVDGLAINNEEIHCNIQIQ